MSIERRTFNCETSGWSRPETSPIYRTCNNFFHILILATSLPSRQILNLTYAESGCRQGPALPTTLYILLLTVIFPFLDLMPVFRCVEGCSRIFAADAHLLRHKKTCRFVQANRQKAQHIRREKGLSATALRDISSLTDRKQRLQVRIVALSMIHLLISAIGITSISHSHCQWRPIFATKRNRRCNGC